MSVLIDGDRDDFPANLLREAHPLVYEGGRATARRVMGREEAETVDEAKRQYTDAISKRWTRTAAWWLGYADEMGEQ